MLKTSETMTKEQLMEISEKYDSMYFSQGTSKAARFALGSSLQLMDAIMTGKVDNGFAIIRPPGHHAMVIRTILNNLTMLYLIVDYNCESVMLQTDIVILIMQL